MSDDTPTAAVPDEQPAAAAGASPKRKRRWWIPVVVVVGVLALLAAGGLVADAAVAASIKAGVRTQFIQTFGLPEDAQVDVGIGGGLVLPQLATGKLAQVSVSAPNFTLQKLAGSLQIQATGVATTGTGSADSLDVAYRIPQTSFSALASQFGTSGSDVTVSLQGQELTFTSQVSVLGVSVPVGVGVTPGAANGAITFTVSSISVGNAHYTADQLKNDPNFSALASFIGQPTSVCVADQLPANLTLTGVSVDGTDLLLTLDGGPIVLSSDAPHGHC